MVVLKRQSIMDVSDENGCIDNFSEMYENELFKYLYPTLYDIPDNACGRFIFTYHENLFEEFFKKNDIVVNNDDAIIINEQLYEWMVRYINELYINNLSKHKFNSNNLWNIYESMTEKIDWSTELVVFEHDW